MIPWYRELSRVQWFVLAAAWLGWVFDIMDASLFSFAKTPMLSSMLGGEAQYKLHGAEIEGRIQMFFLFGWALGGFAFGLLADRWGRTRTLMVTMLLYCAFTGLTALCRTPEQVLVVRLLTALGIGGEWAAGAALVAESLPDRARAGAAAILQSAAAFGPIFGALINLANVQMGNDWRILFLAGIFPALVCIFIRKYVPEPEHRLTNRPAGPLAELWADLALRRNLLVACAIGVVGVTGAGTVPFWLPNLVKAASPGLSAALIGQRTSYATFCLHLGTLAGVVLAPMVAQRIGRRAMFGWFFALSPISVGLMIAGGLDYGRLLVLLPVGSFFTIGLSAGFGLYFPELFPSSVRATGAGLAYNVGRIVSAPVPWITGALITNMGNSVGTGVLIATSIYLLGLLVLPFAPETKGKPLPD